MVGRKSSKNPPILSHEFVIQNHAAIVACISMVFVLGMIFQASSPFASMFIDLHHIATTPPPASFRYEEILYNVGWKDSCAVFFYTLIAVVIHALVQEYALDRVMKKLQIKHSKFNDAGQMLAFALFTSLWGAYIIQKEKYSKLINLFWNGFPHTEMSFVLKFFMLIQLSYWLHWIPETYFLRMKKDESVQKMTISALYGAVTFLAYVSNLSRISVVLLVLHFVPEILLNFARLLHFAEKEGPAEWMFVVAKIIAFNTNILSQLYAVRTWLFLRFAAEFLWLRYLLVICFVGIKVCELSILLRKGFWGLAQTS